MRLFVALDANPKIRTALTELAQGLAPIAPVRWVHPQNMHVTLKYIGDWDERRLDDVIDALSQVRVGLKIRAALAGLEFYPRGRNPKVFWVPVERTLPLRQLASSVDERLAALGIAPEVSPFVPHITLGRLQPGIELTELHEQIEELPSREFGFLEPDCFRLYGSQLTPSGPVCTLIDEFPCVMRVPVSSQPVVTQSL